MPLSISKIQERRKTIPVDVGEGDELSITYRPSVYTSDFESEIRASADAGDKDVVGRMLARLLEDWDLYEDDKQKEKVPLVADRLGSVPIVVLMPIIEAINKDMRPNRRTEGSSSGGSLA